MSSSSSTFSIDGLSVKAPVLLVTPCQEYAAIFQCGESIAILRSQAGRCIVGYPGTRAFGESTTGVGEQFFLSKGYRSLPIPQEGAETFVHKFMQAAGFSGGQLRRTFKLGNPCFV